MKVKRSDYLRVKLKYKAYIELQKAFKKSRTVAFRGLEEMAEIGKQTAKLFAPINTGRVYRYIVIEKDKGNKGIKIRAKNPTASGDYPYSRFRRKKRFNLVRWMHQTGGRHRSFNPLNRGNPHIKNGDPRFMYTTRDFLNAQGSEHIIATGRWRKIWLRFK